MATRPTNDTVNTAFIGNKEHLEMCSWEFQAVVKFTPIPGTSRARYEAECFMSGDVTCESEQLCGKWGRKWVEKLNSENSTTQPDITDEAQGGWFGNAIRFKGIYWEYLGCCRESEIGDIDTKNESWSMSGEVVANTTGQITAWNGDRAHLEDFAGQFFEAARDEM